MTVKCTSFFGKHDWSKWSAPTTMVENSGMIAAINGTKTVVVQQRTCETCGLIESNVIGRYGDTVPEPSIPEPETV